MSGHSHWATIKRSKAANDAKRGRVWSKLARRIIVAAKAGGGNPDENLQLRYAIDDAKAANLPKDTINKAIKKGTGELGAEDYERVIYEGYGPAGVAVMVECLTDNRNRTVPELRKIFERAGGQLGESNCVAWMFTQKGTFTIATSAVAEDALIEICLDAGADDVTKEGDVFEITCEVADFHAVKEALAQKSIETITAEIAMIPNTTVEADAGNAKQILHLMDQLDDHDDVQNIFANFNISDDIAASLETESGRK